LPPGEKGKAPLPATTTQVVVEDEEEEEEDVQPLSRRSRQPKGKILGQGPSGEKRESEDKDALAAPAPKRQRSTAGRGTKRREAVIPVDSETTVSEREVPAGTPATDVEEEVATGGDVSGVPAGADPDPTAMMEPRPASVTEPAAPAVPPKDAEVKAVAEALQEIKAPPRKYRRIQVAVRKTQP
jgi:hypothetical protein